MPSKYRLEPSTLAATANSIKVQNGINYSKKLQTSISREICI
jgi:hypothetical protein